MYCLLKDRWDSGAKLCSQRWNYCKSRLRNTGPWVRIAWTWELVILQRGIWALKMKHRCGDTFKACGSLVLQKYMSSLLGLCWRSCLPRVSWLSSLALSSSNRSQSLSNLNNGSLQIWLICVELGTCRQVWAAQPALRVGNAVLLLGAGLELSFATSCSICVSAGTTRAFQGWLLEGERSNSDFLLGERSHELQLVLTSELSSLWGSAEACLQSPLVFIWHLPTGHAVKGIWGLQLEGLNYLGCVFLVINELV